MLITGTGFFGTDRAELKALTKQLGAHYSGELVRGATTVLVVPDSWLSEGEISDKCRKVHVSTTRHGFKPHVDVMDISAAPYVSLSELLR
jgi:hypothetical protein